MKEQCYLKCEYAERSRGILFPKEYFISFNSADEERNWAVIKPEDFLKIDNKKGLVRIVSLEESGEGSAVLVRIKGAFEKKNIQVYIPKGEIVKQGKA